MNEETFGGRLRRERERRQIPLSSISANSKISPHFFEALERNDVSHWPRGIFRRAFIRAYATGVGLDPDTIAKEFLENFPDLAGLTPMTVREAPTSAHTAWHGSFERKDTEIRLTLADTTVPFVRGRLLPGMRRRCAAVGCDAALILAVAGGSYVVSGSFWMPLGVFTLLYNLVGVLLLNSSPGVWLCASTRRRKPPSDRLRHASPPVAARSLLADLRNSAVRATRVDQTEDLPV
jgi:hypothetical protein